MPRRRFLLCLALLLYIFVPAQVITTIAGKGTAGYSGDGGQATRASLSSPKGMAVDAQGALYIGDWSNRVIRKVDPGGMITTFAGTGIPGYSGDGGPALQARLHTIDDIEFDRNGNLYFAEHGNQVIRKISPAGVITTIAGTGVIAPNGIPVGDGGPATQAQLYTPHEISLDGKGSLYIADVSSNFIRRVDANGIIQTIAGRGLMHPGYSGDGGPAAAAMLNTPISIEADEEGNLYIADMGNHVIRKINTAGLISTIAGNGAAGYSGDGGPATQASLSRPNGLCIDSEGNLYIADEDHHVIRKVDKNGIITTFAGTGTKGYTGDGGPARAAQLTIPTKLAVDAAGNVYVADESHHVIRKITPCRQNTGIAVSVVPSATEICQGQPITFTAHATPNDQYTYQWQLNDQFTGAKETTFTVPALKPGDKVICLVGTNDGCSSILSIAPQVTVHPTPVVSFREDPVIPPGASVELKPLVTGSILQYQWTPSAGLSSTDIANPRASPSATTTYQLLVRSDKGCSGEAKVTVTLFQPLLMPSGFTPNGDGKNEVFRVPSGTTFTLKRFSIYNRWGQTVFQTTNAGEGWNGTIHGRPAPPGAYIYFLSGKQLNDDKTVTGTFLLIR